MQVLVELIDRWRSEGLVLLAPEIRSSACEAFRSAGSHATSDVIALYAGLGGMEDMDKECWRLWPLEEVRAESATHPHDGVLFSDYLMNCWCYRLKPNTDDTSSVLVDYFDGRQPTVVARTLGEFFEAYAANATLLLDAQSLFHIGANNA